MGPASHRRGKRQQHQPVPLYLTSVPLFPRRLSSTGTAEGSDDIPFDDAAVAEVSGEG